MSVSDKIRDLFFPPKCILCNRLIKRRVAFCDRCLPEVPFVEGKICRVCGIPLSEEFPSPICARCREIKPAFQSNTSLLEHKQFGRRSVLAMKYEKPYAAYDLARLLAYRLSSEQRQVDCITSVPMRRWDEWRSGRNVAYTLALYIAKTLSIPHKELLCKVRKTEKQKTLSAHQRVFNVRGAYAVHGDVSGQRILLIDDVFTTGATLNECAKVLKRAGAACVYTATVSIRDRL